jgi:hypothetical protein
MATPPSPAFWLKTMGFREFLPFDFPLAARRSHAESFRQGLALHDAHFWVSQPWQQATRTPANTLQGVAAQAGPAAAPQVAIASRLLRRRGRRQPCEGH